MASPVYGTCPTCGERMLPVLPFSPCGHDAPPIERPLDSIGVVYSWTATTTPDGPRLMAMADFFDGALRVTGPVMGAEKIAIGDEVRASIGIETPITLIPVTSS